MYYIVMLCILQRILVVLVQLNRKESSGNIMTTCLSTTSLCTFHKIDNRYSRWCQKLYGYIRFAVWCLSKEQFAVWCLSKEPRLRDFCIAFLASYFLRAPLTSHSLLRSKLTRLLTRESDSTVNPVGNFNRLTEAFFLFFFSSIDHRPFVLRSTYYWEVAMQGSISYSK